MYILLYYVCITIIWMKFEDFDNVLISNDWSILLKKIEKKYLISQKVADLHQKKYKEDIAEVTRHLLIWKYKIEVNCINA